MSYSSEVLADSPLLYWRLGESSGTTAADTSGNGRTGTYNGGPALGATGLVGDSNTAVSFDGTNDYVTGAAPATTSAFTFEVWINLPGPAATRMIANRYGAAGNRIFLVQTLSTGVANLSVQNAAGTNGNLNGVTTVIGNGAHHIVCTYDGANLKLYVDGSLDASVAFTGALANVTPPLEVGARTATPTWTVGTFDEVALYSTALTATRIAAHRSAGTPPPPITVIPGFTAAATQTYAPAIQFGQLTVSPGFRAAATQAFAPTVTAGAERNITVSAEVQPSRLRASVIDPDRSAEVQPPRNHAGVKP